MIGVGLGIGLGDNLAWEELQLRAARGDAAAAITLEMLDHMARCGQVERLPALTPPMESLPEAMQQTAERTAVPHWEAPRYQAPARRSKPT